MLITDCPICALHGDPVMVGSYEIERSDLWVLRHHPDPAPLVGWLLLDSLRHCSGPLAFNEAEAADWGQVVRAASGLVQNLTGCERVYAIAFGEGAQHLHLHLIPRFLNDPATAAWSVADHYRAVASGDRQAAGSAAVQELVRRARTASPLLASRH